MSEEHTHCNEPGCTEPVSVTCYVDTSEPEGNYCWTHARENGFCPVCGNFWAGTEYFDFRLNGTDMCQNCYYDTGTDDDYPDDEDWFDDYIEYEDIIEGETGGRYIGPGSDYLPDDSEETE